ncbi:hypothetical protein [Azospirillum doebereinerae]|uniref:hypothetical protein n=1 Tax=Azospirillum doebereinerae TaxID=92933 RepID=UPI003CC818A2
MLAQQVLQQDPFAGHLFIFRGRQGYRTSFSIQFRVGTGRVSLAPAARAEAPGREPNRAWRSSGPLARGAARNSSGTARLDVRCGLLP